MTVKGEVAKYRERLDKTLASHDLTDEETLKTLVKDHMLRSKEQETQDSSEYVINKRTSELSNILGMLRIPSESNEGTQQDMSHASWKLKQDTEEFRVMYREGPEGSPYHTLLVEGYVDAPVDACLCISVETALYPSWFPETKVPTFKITLAQCLKKIRVGENLSLVRMKLSWPLSNREALMHFFEFEYLQDDLVVVMINTPEVESIQMEIHDFSDDNVPEAGETVRIGMVGGFALQKVTAERSYFRTIANMDVKLDFVPPWLINFVSRQLIGTGFKLYKKILTTKSKDDEHIAKALNDPLYVRIRKALYQSNEINSTSNIAIDHGDTLSSPKEQDNHDDDQVPSNGRVSESSPEYVDSSDWKPCNEIEEEEIQEIKNSEDCVVVNQQNTEIESATTNHLPKANYTTECNFDHHKNVRLSPQVQKALGTLDKAISAVREARSRSQTASLARFSTTASPAPFSTTASPGRFSATASPAHFSTTASPGRFSATATPVRFSTEGSPKVEIAQAKLMPMEDYGVRHLNNTPPLTPPKTETMHRSLQNSSNRSSIANLRLNPPAKDVNSNRLAPASPELILSSSNASPQVNPDLMENGCMGTPNSSIKANGVIHEDKSSEQRKNRQQKKWKICCLHLVPGRLVS